MSSNHRGRAIEMENNLPKRNHMQAMTRGFLLRCPKCGVGKLFGKFLKVKHICDNCKEELHHHRADDAPPYFTIFIVGHIIVSAVLLVEVAFKPAIWLHMAMWIPLTVLLSLALLSSVKGAIVGLQWSLYLHGFDPRNQDEHSM